VVRDLNTKIVTFPSNIIAGMFSFQPRQFFQTETPEDRATPVVKF
jgi:LemA protein